ncbi:MAG TPA: endonuclease III [Anaeromyxobacteraceae bacterium]|nr:endonuclease III [Anaeromyxobacteraceae bacterium]
MRPRRAGSGQSVAERAKEVFLRLDREMPGARIALEYQGDVQLLVAVILSAQCTDARVNMVTPALFARFPDAAAFGSAQPRSLWPYLKSCGLFRVKAKNIVAAMREIELKHGGRVPRDRAALEALPGVGRKTAGVVLIHLGAGDGFPVDTHVGRVARRLGLAREKEPRKVEERLMELFPRAGWGRMHQLFVWHGRRTCAARAPDCARCTLADLCPKVGT